MAAIAATVGASLLGDWMSSQSQQATNQTSENIAAANNATSILLSETAMQNRVQDLKKAGLNPMLAVGTPGAVVPNMQQPNLSNPGAAYGQLGGQVSNAVQLATMNSQIRKQNADAAYTEALTPSDDVLPVDADGHVSIQDIIQSPHGGMLGKMNVAQSMATVDQINATTDNLKSTTDVNKAIKTLRDVDITVAKGSASALIQKAVNDANLGSADVSIEQARARVLGGPAGPWIQAAESVLGGGFVGTVIGKALSKIGGGGGTTTETSTYGPGGVHRGGSVTTVTPNRR